MIPVDSGPARTVREPRFKLGDLLGEPQDALETERWQELSGALWRRPLPPALRRKLGVGDLSDILKRSVVGFPAKPRWRRLDESLLAELEQWSPYGLELPVVAFAPGAGPENGLSVRGGIEVLTVDASSLALGRESALFYRQKDGGLRKINATVHRHKGGSVYHLSVGQTLTVCSGCGLYLLPEKFNYHEPVVAGRPSCRRSRSAYRPVSSGSHVESELWAYQDPERYIRAYGNLVRGVAEGEATVFSEGFASDLFTAAYCNRAGRNAPR